MARAMRALRLESFAAASASASIEVIYGHAWKGAPRKLADGRSIVQFDKARREFRSL